MKLEGFGFRIYVLRSTCGSQVRVLSRGPCFALVDETLYTFRLYDPYDPNHLHSIPKALNPKLNSKPKQF